MKYTETKKYAKFQEALARKKAAKKKASAEKGSKTRKENQRIRNEKAGLGYHTDTELKWYKKHGEMLRKEWDEKRERGLREYYKRKRKEREKEKRAKEREREREKKKKLAEELKLKEKKRRAAERKKATAERRRQREIEKRKEKFREYRRKVMTENNINKPRPFLVYIAENGKSYKNVNRLGRFYTLEAAREKVKELREAEKDIMFEKQTRTYPDGTMQSKFEYVIYKDVKDNEPKPTYLKNEFGKYVEHTVEIRGHNYEMIEKYDAKVEDKVWVYGCDPRYDRKTFSWVFDNVLNEGFSSSYDMKRIYLYHNKVIFCNDANEIDIVICKTERDATRFYITLQKHCQKGPYLFMGSVTTGNAMCEPLEKLLVDKTGWTVDKLRRNQHRF